jgi:formamidopyrimidine-DNA glycosylase
LAKLRLVHGDPLLSEPISKLGFDPVLDMPSYEDFHKRVTKRAVPIKALLLDQSFSAGVGNWVADEILYQAEVHPGQYTNTLLDEEVKGVYEKTKSICDLAVRVEADESKFPDHWLMKYRWNKGKGLGKGILPDGTKLEFTTVGGRTSAIDPAKQILRTIKAEKKVIKVEEKTAGKRDINEKGSSRKKVRKAKEEQVTVVKEEEVTIVKRTTRSSTRNLTK